MKTLLFLCFFIALSGNIYANMRQSNWRWRNDDGTETTATWKAAPTTAIVMSSRSATMRLRILADETSSSGTSGFSQELQYATSTGGPWTTISTSGGDFMIAGSSAFVTDNTATTSQIGFAKPFNAGKVMVSSTTATYAIDPNSYTEVEWAIKGTANTLTNTTYYFQLTPLSSGVVTYPSLTTANVLPVNLVSFTVTGKNNAVILAWTTTQEINNDRFEIMRSIDGHNWKKIGSVAGKATSNTLTNYEFSDEKPLSGLGFYKINQYDFDGKFSASEIRSVKMNEQREAIINVFPNPSNAGIGFSIANKNFDAVEVTLVNAIGITVHKEIFKNISPEAVNKLKLVTPPAAGIYTLKFQSGDQLQTKQVIVQ